MYMKSCVYVYMDYLYFFGYVNNVEMIMNARITFWNHTLNS